MSVTGLSVNGFVNAPNQGIVFFPLKPFVNSFQDAFNPLVDAPAFAWGNLAWVAASFGVIALVQPNMLGTAFVAVQALAVAAIAGLQFHALASDARVSV
mgnify:CR=1 FL=1